MAINSITGTKGDLINKSGWVLNFKGQYGRINKNTPLINNKAINDVKFFAEVKGVFLDKGIFLYFFLYRKSEF